MENFKPNRGEIMGHIYSAGGINFSGEYLTALTGTGPIHLFLPLEKTKEGKKILSCDYFRLLCSRWEDIVADFCQIFLPLFHQKKKKQNESSSFINQS